MRNDLLGALAAIVGEKNVLAGEREASPYLTDWRKQFSGAAACVVRPASTAEVADTVRLCAQAGVAIVPQGGNTGLVGGSVPTGERPEIVLQLGRMNRIRAIDTLNDTVTAEAGCVLADLQRAADDAGRLFALSLAAEGSCQIGGNLSTNAGGVNVLRYGNARDQVLGLEAVLPDGRVWDGLRGLRKDNTGYDLKQLFIGAEGTLGVITAAVLKLHPKPTASATAWIAAESPARVVELLAHMRAACGDRLSAFELVSRNCVDAVLAHRQGVADPLPAQNAPWFVLAQLDDSGSHSALGARLEQAIAEAIERSIARDAVIARNEDQRRRLWSIRESIPEAQFTNVKHDISVPISRIPEFVERAGAALSRAFPGEPVYCFGHVGDGNLHYNVGSPALVARRDEVNRLVYEAVDALGGSISAEHGLGQLKRDEIARHKPAIELDLMRAVKRALDPQGLMNPGKVL
ncbi:MAG TPA: FAD-binding oxidoreductase [Burkholderiales bacterium]|jgi:FAD/FMN-containing dehydrogenase|nr:FAD-binding oxidoreductase [Burkholderiales bacterium]